MSKAKIEPSEDRISCFKLYTLTFQQSRDLLRSVMLTEAWPHFVKFAAQGFISAYDYRDENYAKCVLEDLKNSLLVLADLEEFSKSCDCPL